MAKTFDEKINELTELKNSIDISKLQKNKEICLKQLNNLLGDNMLDSGDDRVKTKMSELNDINNKIKLADKIVKDIDFLEKRREEIRELHIYSRTTKWLYELFKDDPVYEYAKKYDKKDIIEKIKNRSLSMDEYDKIYLEAKYPNLFRKAWNDVDTQDKNISNEKILENLWISYRKLDWEILPSKASKKIIKWSWHWFKLPWTTGKMGILFTELLTEDNDIYSKDLEVIAWIKIKGKLRQLPYIAVKIPGLNKTILINENSGEATYIYDGILWDDALKNIHKSSIDNNMHKINFTKTRREKMKELLFGEVLEKKENERYIENKKEYIKKTLHTEGMKERWFNLTTNDRLWFTLPDWTTYQKIARIFWFDYKTWKTRNDICLSKEVYNGLTKLIYWPDCFVESEEDIRKILYNPEMINSWFNLVEVKQRSHFKLTTGTNYTKIARVFGFDNDINEIYSQRIYKELWKKIYGKDYNHFEIQYWIGKEYRTFISENFIKWFKMTKKGESLLRFKYNGWLYWFMRMQTLLLWDDWTPGKYEEKKHIDITKKFFSEWELLETLKIQQNLIINKLRNNKKFKEKRFWVKPWNFHAIRFEWELNYISLVRILLFNQRINGDWKFDIYWTKTYNQLTKIIFW